MASPPGILYVVGTPIGNLDDITFRAVRILSEIDLIAAEDTRRTGILLAHLQLRKPLLGYHEFNEAKRTPELLQQLRAGRRLALVTDAGMPGVSDPGLRLVRSAIDERIPVEIVPGPSAVTAALVGSGLATEPFLFYGFLPSKSARRRKVLAEFAPLPCTLVFFESPFRLKKSLGDMREILGNRRCVVAREITKKFEEFLRGDLDTLLNVLENRTIKGEITVIINGGLERRNA